MTEDRLPLAELMQKAGDGDFLRSVAEAVVQLLMETDVEGMIGAGRHERSGERTTYRNSYRDRTLDTRLGSLQLRIPKLRQGSYFPPFLEPRKTTEKALVAVIQEAWIGGVSTRRVDDLVQAMGLAGISKSTVSKLCKDIDDRVGAFLDRPLTGDWPYLWLDATYLKQREGGRIVSVAAIIAVAVDGEGKREIVGQDVHQADDVGFFPTDAAAGVEQKGGFLFADDARQRHAEAKAGVEAEAVEVGGETRLRRGDPEVGDQAKAEAATNRGTLHGGNDRLAAAEQADGLLVEVSAAGGADHAAAVAIGEIGAGAEVLAFGAKQDAAEGRIGVEPLKGFGKFADQGLSKKLLGARQISAMPTWPSTVRRMSLIAGRARGR